MKKLAPIVIVVAASQLGATDCGQVLRDPGFDLWCGDSLCTWKVVRGSAARAPTWHTADSGVELVGEAAAISQLAPVTSNDGTCIHFELVANVEDAAETYLAIDVFGDGTIDRMERLPSSRWEPLSYNLRIKAPYDGIRFELSKQGSGRAVFGRIHAELAPEGCAGLPEIDGGPAPLGAGCAADGECDSGMCRLVPEPGSFFGVVRRCVGCDPAAGAPDTCGAEVCGRSAPRSPVHAVPYECVPAAADPIGAPCGGDGECGSGVCNELLVCSECDAAQPCAGGAACAPAWDLGPGLCAGAGRPAGDDCVTDAQCASGACRGGALQVCEGDGRPCGNAIGCPVDDGLTPAACTTVGVAGGSCQ